MKRCFVCSAVLEHVAKADRPRGKYAVDPERGRLWLVCAACGNWNLLPIEARWELIQELERLARDHGRVLARTDNIALVEAASVTIVRIGRMVRKEEAWWRYLQEAQIRKNNARRVIRSGKWKDAFWSLLVLGIPLPGITAAETWLDRARNRQFSKTLWSGSATCHECSAVEQQLEFTDDVVLRATSSELVLRGKCSRCATRCAVGYFEMTGREAERVAQRALAYRNYAGPSNQALTAAVQTLDDLPDATSYLRTVANRPVALARLNEAQLVTLEMAVNESREAKLLGLELRELEARWKAEEELAFIIDRELTPP